MTNRLHVGSTREGWFLQFYIQSCKKEHSGFRIQNFVILFYEYAVVDGFFRVLSGVSTLLRYPGGKSRLVKQIWLYLEPLLYGTDLYAEPMAGGGHVALEVARLFPRKRLLLNDLDLDLAMFWKVVSGCAGDYEFKQLCRLIENSREPTDDFNSRFDFWKNIRDSVPSDPAEQAFRYLLLNKTAFGGQVDEGPMGGWAQTGWKCAEGERGLMCQYNVTVVLRNLLKTHELLKGRTSVYSFNAIDLLHEVGPCAVYLDPPYFPGAKNNLYRVQMSVEQHLALAEILRGTDFHWLLSYDQSPAICELYDWAEKIELRAKYSHAPGSQSVEKKLWKGKTELLIRPNNRR